MTVRLMRSPPSSSKEPPSVQTLNGSPRAPNSLRLTPPTRPQLSQPSTQGCRRHDRHHWTSCRQQARGPRKVCQGFPDIRSNLLACVCIVPTYDRYCRAHRGPGRTDRNEGQPLPVPGCHHPRCTHHPTPSLSLVRKY